MLLYKKLLLMTFGTTLVVIIIVEFRGCIYIFLDMSNLVLSLFIPAVCYRYTLRLKHVVN